MVPNVIPKSIRAIRRHTKQDHSNQTCWHSIRIDSQMELPIESSKKEKHKINLELISLPYQIEEKKKQTWKVHQHISNVLDIFFNHAQVELKWFLFLRPCKQAWKYFVTPFLRLKLHARWKEHSDNKIKRENGKLSSKRTATHTRMHTKAIKTNFVEMKIDAHRVCTADTPCATLFTIL